MQRSKFCGALGLDPARPIVLYATAANDPEEPARLNWLAGRLGAMEGAPQLLIRSNPMDASDRPYRALAAAPGVALLEPKWEWRPEQEWSCPLPEDLPWWRGALEHAALAVTLPSTIALDYAAWGKPAVLLAWGRGASLWGEPGYEAVRRTEGALTAWSPGEAAARIERVLRDPPKLPPQFGDSVGAAVRLAARAFHGALPSAPPVSRPRAVTP
jgi:hypothetical protein